jgi:uncharacterized membrane protein YcjF (UPF0283 family)
VLFVAIAICVLAMLVGLVVVVRSALRLGRRLGQLQEVAATARELVEQGEQLRARAVRLRDDSERIRTLAQLFI